MTSQGHCWPTVDVPISKKMNPKDSMKELRRRFVFFSNIQQSKPEDFLRYMILLKAFADRVL